jgi:acetyl-CoA carboxylase, biotin carboxylase subunit
VVFRTILIANRGEIAVRIIRTCRDLGIRAAVAYSAADRDSLAVRLADDAVCVGPDAASRSYCNIPAILYACAKVGAEAVHPGYGFLAEDATFAAACEQVGVDFIGPSVRHVAMMGDKLAARAAMHDAGLPVLPGSPGAVADAADATRMAEEIGYPVLLKAAAGGGGRGITRVDGRQDMAEAFRSTVRAAQATFQDARVYVEKLVEGARHVEVQILGDQHGQVVHLGERDCSVQRRRQKIVEESPSPALSDAVRDRLCELAVAGARAVAYHSAGTVEFLVDGHGDAYFIEMNPRLQVEHPVTELRSGIDLVAAMIRVAAGEPLGFTQQDVRLAGHAIEVRINAEDAARDFAGSCGRISGLHLPSGPNVRVDTHAFDGWFVSPFYDSLLAKVIVAGPDRETALVRLERALSELRVSGVATNQELHRMILRSESFKAGRYGLDFLASLVPAASP